MDFSQWCFLSKDLNDQYINMLAASVGSNGQDHVSVEALGAPLVLRGIMKHKIMKQCWQLGKNFFYVDTGYLGNHVSDRNPRANKIWHRIVPNNLQHEHLQPAPADRWQKLGLCLPRRRHGRNIIVAAPDDKPCRFYGIDQQQWINSVTNDLNKVTDRPITVRLRQRSRQTRMVQQPLNVLLADAHALVTYNSLAAIEAIMQGVPAIVLAPCHAARAVASVSVESIENPMYPDQDLLHDWLCWLCYGQYHVTEMRSGRAMHMLAEKL
jgi:hypothetical protein